MSLSRPAKHAPVDLDHTPADEQDRYFLEGLAILDHCDAENLAGRLIVKGECISNRGSELMAEQRAAELERLLCSEPEVIAAVACDSGRDIRAVFAFDLDVAEIRPGERWLQTLQPVREMFERVKRSWRPGPGIALRLQWPSPPRDPEAFFSHHPELRAELEQAPAKALWITPRAERG